MTTVHLNAPTWCSYDQIWKIRWTINGRTTNAFSTRNKRIGETVPSNVKKAEFDEANRRLMIVKDYLEGSITRETANEHLQMLKLLSPRRPTAHLLTMAEFALNLR